MDAKEIMKYMGKKALVWRDGLYVLCNVTNVKQSYGNLRLEVSPVEGKGSVWVQSGFQIVEGE